MEGKNPNIQENNKTDNQRRPEAEERGGQGQGWEWACSMYDFLFILIFDPMYHLPKNN